jgi:hypothetical protein
VESLNDMDPEISALEAKLSKAGMIVRVADGED